MQTPTPMNESPPVDRLVVVNGPEQGRVLSLPQEPGYVLPLGRQYAELPLEDARISREHARLTACDDGWVIADNNSANGTFVNHVRLSEPMLLEHGDLIQLGSVLLVFHAKDHATQTTLPAVTSGRELVRRPETAVVKRIEPREVAVTAYASNYLGNISKRWLMIAAAVLFMIVGGHFYMLMRSHAQTQELTQAVRNLGATPPIDHDALAQRISAAIDRRPDELTQQMLSSILAGVEAAPKLDEVTQAKLDALLLTIESDQSDQQQRVMLEQVLAAVNNRRDAQIEAALHQIHQTIESDDTSEQQTELLQTVLAAVENQRDEQIEAAIVQIRETIESDDTNAKQSAMLAEVLAAVNAPRDKEIENTLARLQQSVEAAAAPKPQPELEKMMREVLDAIEASNQTIAAASTFVKSKPVVVTPTVAPPPTTLIIVDITGSLRSAMPIVAEQIERMVGEGLCSSQHTLLLAGGRGMLTLPADDLAKTNDWSAQAGEWIDKHATYLEGSSAAALTSALEASRVYQPRSVWLFSDHAYGESPTQLLASLKRSGAGHTYQLNTVQFFDRDPSDTLKQIAAKHGGSYTFIIKPAQTALNH